MSKKLLTLIQTITLLGTLGTAYAGDITVDVYEYGNPVGTMTLPASQYPNLVDRMNGTGVTVRRQDNDAKARHDAAQRRVDEWNKQDDQRRAAAQAQQEQWNKQYEDRHAAAQRRVDEWNKQDDQRRAAAQAQQERWNRQFEERHAAAQQGYEKWRAGR
jgi:hypothetical protein